MFKIFYYGWIFGFRIINLSRVTQPQEAPLQHNLRSSEAPRNKTEFLLMYPKNFQAIGSFEFRVNNPFFV